ncbi:hypothetical protein NQ160_05755 [Microbacterium sp. zg.Y909]|nr:hypothetical protein [Microbacterium sp. zg.Y909]
MSRQRLAIGTFGDIGFLPTAHGRVMARARFRDWDGRTRLVQSPQTRTFLQSAR